MQGDALLINRNPSVVSRDVARHGGRAEYRAVTADDAAAAAGHGRRHTRSTGHHAADGGHRALEDRLFTGVNRGPVACQLRRRSGCTGVTRGDLTPLGIGGLALSIQ